MIYHVRLRCSFTKSALDKYTYTLFHYNVKVSYSQIFQVKLVWTFGKLFKRTSVMSSCCKLAGQQAMRITDNIGFFSSYFSRNFSEMFRASIFQKSKRCSQTTTKYLESFWLQYLKTCDITFLQVFQRFICSLYEY